MFENLLVSDDGRASGRDALRLARQLADEHASYVLASAERPGLLRRLAREELADLIVVPAGRDAKRTLHGAHVPVALAPEGYADRPDDGLRVIGVGFDGEPESRVALHAAEQLALARRATMRVCSAVPAVDWAAARGVEPTPEQYRYIVKESLAEKLQQEAKTLDGRVRAAASAVKGEPAEVLAEQSRQGMDLLVVGSRGHGPLDRVLLGSVSDELVDRVACPLLVIPRGASPQEPQTKAAA